MPGYDPKPLAASTAGGDDTVDLFVSYAHADDEVPAGARNGWVTTLVDISHEALIRGWDRLRALVEWEAALAAQYGRWRDRSEHHRHTGGERLSGTDLQAALRWRSGHADLESGVGRMAEGSSVLPPRPARRRRMPARRRPMPDGPRPQKPMLWIPLRWPTNGHLKPQPLPAPQWPPKAPRARPKRVPTMPRARRVPR